MDKEVNIIINTKVDGLVKSMSDVTVATEKVVDATKKVEKTMNDAFTKAPVLTNVTKNWKEFSEEAKAAGKNIEQIKQEWKVYMKAANDASGATKLIESGFKNIDKSSQSLRTQLRQVVQELAQMDVAGQKGSARYVEMSKRAGLLKDALNDANQSVKNFGSDTRHIDGVLQGVQGLIGTYSIFQGVLGLVGTESEKLQQVERKMQSLLGIMIGLQQVQNLVQKESAFMQTLMAAKESVLSALRKKSVVDINAQTAAIIENTVANNGANVSTESLTKSAGAGLGTYGLLAAAIVALTYYVYEYKSSLGEAAQASNDLQQATDSLDDSMNIASASISQSITSLNSYVKRLRESGLTEAELARKELENITKNGKIRADAARDKANINEEAIKQMEAEISANNKIIISGEATTQSIREREERNQQLTLGIIEQRKQQIENLKTASAIRISNQKDIKQAEEILSLEEKRAAERKKATDDAKKSADDTKKAIRDQKDIIEPIPIIKDTDISDAVKKNANQYIEYYKKLQSAVRNNTEISNNIELDIVGKVDVNFDTPEFNEQKKDIWQKFAEALFGEKAVDDMDISKALQSGVEKLLSTAFSAIDSLISKSYDANIKALENYISTLDKAVDETQSALAEQQRLQDEGSASNVAREKKRLAELKAARDQAIKDKEEQVRREKELERTMTTVKAVAAAVEVIAQSATQGGVAGVIVGIVEALALIATIATLYSNANSQITFAKGTAEILGGKPHSQGGTSLGQYGTAEKGEFLGILNKQQSKKYGPALVSLFDGLNENNKSKTDFGLMSLGDKYVQSSTQDVNVELKEIPEIRGIYKEIRKPSKSIVYEKGRRIEKFGNVTRIIYN